MQPHEVRKKREEIEASKLMLEADLLSLQEHCSHENRDKTKMVPTGAFVPYENSYWISYHCPDCKRSWRERTTNPVLIKEPVTPGYTPWWLDIDNTQKR